MSTVERLAGEARSLRPRLTIPTDLATLIPGAPPVAVTGVTLDSRLVRPGDLYVALPGTHHHGARFATAAAAGGASAVLTDVAGAELAGSVTVPVVVARNPREQLARIAAEIFGNPAEAMTMYAVTGTNGKTTTTFLLEAALAAAGVRTGLIGTIGFRLDGATLPGARTTVTTPEAPELQALLGFLREAGAEAVLMEVSSHALVLGRADQIRFAVAGFTNLGRDHLDFHPDEEAYFAAKASLFTAEHSRHAVINIDDPRGAELAAQVRRAGELGLTTVSLSADADCQVQHAEVAADGRTRVSARLGDQRVEFRLNLPGDFNVRNALTALAMIAATGGDVAAAATGSGGRLGAGPAAAGRPRPGGTGRLRRLRPHPAGGRRGSSRPGGSGASPRECTRGTGAGSRCSAAGATATRSSAARWARPPHSNADLVVITDDNPRSEAPEAIRAQVLTGARAAVQRDALATEVLDGGDRRSAIRQALEHAGPGDVVAVLGRGHEPDQEIAGGRVPFSDAAVVAEEWAALQGVRR